MSNCICPIAFYGLTVHPSNIITSCMLTENKLASVKESNGIDNDNFVKLRENMKAGIWNHTDEYEGYNIDSSLGANCGTCLHQEAKGIHSDRKKWLSKAHSRNPEYALKNNPIIHLNLNLSNVCNFKCRMCGPKYSNAWIPDAKFLKKQSPDLVRPFEDSDTKQFIDYHKLLDNYGSRFDLRSCWITGGEPFMDKRIFGFLSQLKHYTPIEKLDVNITTNGSKIDFDKILELKKFKSICLNISVDATGKLFDYMRSAGVFSYEKLYDNIEKLLQLKNQMPNLKVQVNGSYQVYNSLNIYDFYYTFTNKLKVDDIQMRCLSHPLHLDASIMPKQLKAQAISQVRKIINDDTVNIHERIEKDLENILINLKHEPKNKNELWNKFISFTNLLDINRKENITNACNDIAKEMI